MRAAKGRSSTPRHSTLTLTQARARWGAQLERKLLDDARAAGLLGEMLRHQVRIGGKRLRSLIPAWLCHNLGGCGEDALDLGVALELLHNGSLVHDDAQDGDTQRRGAETVWSRWSLAQAINAGDAFVFRSFEVASRARIGARAVTLIAQVGVRVVEGQTMDLQLHATHGAGRLPPTLDTYFRMAEGKTAALFGLALELGAIAAGVDPHIVVAAAEHGRHLGLMFNVQDDLLDTIGDRGSSRPGGDIRSKKVNYLVAWALGNGLPEAVRRLRQLLEVPPNETTDAMVGEAIDILEQTGAIAATQRWLDAAYKTARTHPMDRFIPGLCPELCARVAHIPRQVLSDAS